MKELIGFVEVFESKKDGKNRKKRLLDKFILNNIEINTKKIKFRLMVAYQEAIHFTFFNIRFCPSKIYFELKK